MKDIVTQAAEHMVASADPGPTFNFTLPYIWAYGLCMAGRRLGFMQWLHQFCSALGLVIDSIRDGDDGSVLFVAVPITKENNGI